MDRGIVWNGGSGDRVTWSMATRRHVYVWEFIVAPAHARAFERASGPGGEWTALFRRAPGYICTEPLRDLARADRYLTIDHWESRERWDDFRTRFAVEYQALDAKCAGWTIRETELGRFEAPS